MLMAELDLDYDGWALSCSIPSLAHLLPAAPPGTRVAAWVKPFAAYKRNVRVAYTWEPVLWKRTAPRRDRRPRRPRPPVLSDHDATRTHRCQTRSVRVMAPGPARLATGRPARRPVPRHRRRRTRHERGDAVNPERGVDPLIQSRDVLVAVPVEALRPAGINVLPRALAWTLDRTTIYLHPAEIEDTDKLDGDRMAHRCLSAPRSPSPSREPTRRRPPTPHPRPRKRERERDDPRFFRTRPPRTSSRDVCVSDA